jgi:hypothetical protein
MRLLLAFENPKPPVEVMTFQGLELLPHVRKRVCTHPRSISPEIGTTVDY